MSLDESNGINVRISFCFELCCTGSVGRVELNVLSGNVETLNSRCCSMARLTSIHIMHSH